MTTDKPLSPEESGRRDAQQVMAAGYELTQHQIDEAARIFASVIRDQQQDDQSSTGQPAA